MLGGVVAGRLVPAEVVVGVESAQFLAHAGGGDEVLLDVVAGVDVAVAGDHDAAAGVALLLPHLGLEVVNRRAVVEVVVGRLDPRGLLVVDAEWLVGRVVGGEVLVEFLTVLVEVGHATKGTHRVPANRVRRHARRWSRPGAPPFTDGLAGQTLRDPSMTEERTNGPAQAP